MKKYVLTGAPSSGKSSILLALEKEFNYLIIREAAEDLIKFYQANGIKEPWLLEEFQDELLKLQLQRELSVENNKAYKEVFIDRGIVDGLAYYQFDKKELSSLMKLALENLKQKPYKKVFLIEKLGTYQKTKVRKESQEEADFLEKLQEKNYQDQGYEVIRIKSAPIKERVKEILKHI